MKKSGFRATASIRDRIVAIFAVGASILLVLTCGVLYIAFDAQLDSTVDDALRVRADDIAEDLRQGKTEIRSGEPFAELLAAGTGRVIDATTQGARSDPVLSRRDLERARNHEIVVERRKVTGLGDFGRVLARPDITAGGEPVVIVVGESLDTVGRARERLGLLLGIASPLLIGGVAGAGWILAGAALHPVERMTVEAETISLKEGGRRRLRQPPGDDEIAHLGRTLNAMIDRIEFSLERERAFVDDASHELRTPLSILRAELELASGRRVRRAELERTVRSALAEAEQLSRLTEDLLTLARADSGRLDLALEPVDLLAASRQAADRYRSTASAGLDVGGDPVLVSADPGLVDRVLANLIVNAGRHATSRTVVEVASNGDHGIVTVADDGPGFPEEFLPSAFDRFARADADRGRDHGGSGLGLAIVAAVVRALGGQVQVGNGPPLGGARVQVWLPLSAAGKDGN